MYVALGLRPAFATAAGNAHRAPTSRLWPWLSQSTACHSVPRSTTHFAAPAAGGWPDAQRVKPKASRPRPSSHVYVPSPSLSDNPIHVADSVYTDVCTTSTSALSRTLARSPPRATHCCRASSYVKSPGTTVYAIAVSSSLRTAGAMSVGYSHRNAIALLQSLSFQPTPSTSAQSSTPPELLGSPVLKPS